LTKTGGEEDAATRKTTSGEQSEAATTLGVGDEVDRQ